MYSYGSDEPLDTAGEFEAELGYKNKYCIASFVVVEEKATAILSCQTSGELGVLKIMVNSVSEASLFEEFKECFEEVGKLKDFQAKLHIIESVKPVAQKQRLAPFVLREEIENKLEELIDNDIIEPVVGPTPWVSPVVVVPKPSCR